MNRLHAQIVGVSDEESEALLSELYAPYNPSLIHLLHQW